MQNLQLSIQSLSAVSVVFLIMTQTPLVHMIPLPSLQLSFGSLVQCLAMDLLGVGLAVGPGLILCARSCFLEPIAYGGITCSALIQWGGAWSCLNLV